jgi:hypothetical protein
LVSALIAWGIGGLGSCMLSVIGLSICTIPIFIIGGMATTGLVLGWIGNGLNVLLIMATCVILVLILLSPSIGNVFSNIVRDI